MDEGFFNIQIVLEIIRNDLILIASDVVNVGRSLGAIGALLYTALLAYNAMIGGGDLFSLKVLRPFVLALVLMLYPQFMLVIDGMAMAVNTSLGKAMITDEYRVTDILKTRDLDPETDNDDNLLGIEDIHAEEGEEEASLVDELTDAVSGSLKKFYYALMRFVEEILFRLSHAILIIINALRVFILVVLYICGPLVIGMSMFPGFESNYMRWLGRYLSVHLWLGIGNIFEAMAVRLWRIIVENGGFWTRGLGLEDSVNSVILTTWSWIFLLVLIVGYLTIPFVASWVISGSGMGRAGALLATTATRGVASAGRAVAKDTLYKK